jgi:beta-lactamase regulating signal transducer with metallopeptidase domain
VSLLWIAPIGVPVLPANEARTDHGETRGATVPREVPFPRAADVTARRAVVPGVATPNGAEVPWTPLVLGLWGAGLGVVLLRTARQWRATRGVVARAVRADAGLQETARDLAGRLGLRRAAEVMLSTEVDSPLITGVRRAVILVPADRFALLSPEQQRMALCHELAHMKRGDLWLGCVPALVERCFFFHPLARLAAREYAFWREAACDEAVLVVLGASPQAYGRLLLALGVSRQPATFAAAGAAWSFSTLKRRIVMLGHPTSSSLGGRLLATSAVALAVLAIAPVRAVARTSSSAPEPAVSRTQVESAAPTIRPIAAPGVRCRIAGDGRAAGAARPGSRRAGVRGARRVARRTRRQCAGH